MARNKFRQWPELKHYDRWYKMNNFTYLRLSNLHSNTIYLFKNNSATQIWKRCTLWTNRSEDVPFWNTLILKLFNIYTRLSYQTFTLCLQNTGSARGVRTPRFSVRGLSASASIRSPMLPPQSSTLFVALKPGLMPPHYNSVPWPVQQVWLSYEKCIASW